MKKRLLVLFFALFIAMIGFGIALPALTFFVERLAFEGSISFEALAMHVGALTSAYAVTQLGFAPLWGRWSDRKGRKPLVVAGLVGFAVAQVAFGLGTTLPVLYGARLVGGAFAAALLTASAAYVADWLPEEHRSWGMAWRNTAISLGVVVGPAMSGFLALSDIHIDLKTEHLVFDGFSVPFFAAAGLALATVPAVLRWLPESLSSTPRAAEARHGRWWFDLGEKLKGLMLLVFVSAFALALFEAVFTLFAVQTLNLGMVEIGYAFVLCGIVMAVFQGGVVAYLAGRISEKVQIAAGFLTMGAGLWLLPMSKELPAVFGAVAVLGVGFALISPNLLTLVANRGEPHTGTALGLLNAFTGLGQVAGPLVGGLLFVVNVDRPFEVAGTLILGIALWMIARHRRRFRTTATTPTGE